MVSRGELTLLRKMYTYIFGFAQSGVEECTWTNRQSLGRRCTSLHVRRRLILEKKDLFGNMIEIVGQMFLWGFCHIFGEK